MSITIDKGHAWLLRVRWALVHSYLTTDRVVANEPDQRRSFVDPISVGAIITFRVFQDQTVA